MEAQLRLLSAPEPTLPATHDEPTDRAPALEVGPVAWRLSTSTRELGRRGIEDARAALQGARTATTRTTEDGRHQQSSAA